MLARADLVAHLVLPAAVPAFCVGVSGALHPSGESAAGRRRFCPLLYLAGRVLGLARVAVVTGRSWPTATFAARADRVARLCVSVGLPARRTDADHQCAEPAPIDDRPPPVAMDRLGIGRRRRAVCPLRTLPFPRRLVPPLRRVHGLLLGCIPLAFASAIVRYRLMDIEVIIKRALVVSAVGLVLVVIYQGTLTLVGLPPRHARRSDNSFWALFATLVVVLVAPRLWNVMQGGLDRLYYRDRYDYRRALVTLRARAQQRSGSGAAEHTTCRARDRDARRGSDGVAPCRPG